MRIAYLAAGAAGMYCGSCIHDNTVAAALLRLGHEVALLPTYTPLKTDETDVSGHRVFYGAVNVYLQQKLGFFRHTPRLVDWLLDRPALLNFVSRFAASTNARELGELTVSMLEGEQGHQAKELDKLVDWLAEDYRPQLVHLTNSMFLGMARRIKERVGVPVVVGLVGEDLFLEDLIEPYRSRAFELLAERAADADAFIAPSRYYAAKMSSLLRVPLERVRVVPLGLQLEPHREGDLGLGARDGATMGFLARICPEKGFHLVVGAFLGLAHQPGFERLKLKAAGWLGAKDTAFFEEQQARVADAGLADRFAYLGEVDLAGKVSFLRSLDLMVLPTVYRESKGLPVLEALANAVPVVVPRHGSFVELVAATGGGLLVDPGSSYGLESAITALLEDPARRRALGAAGREAVLARFGDDAMARGMESIYQTVIGGDRNA